MRDTEKIEIRLAGTEEAISFAVEELRSISGARNVRWQLDRMIKDVGEESVPVDQSSPVVLIDLSKLGWIGSVGLNELISMNRSARSRGVRIVLQNVQDSLRSIFQLTRLERMFEFEPESEVDSAVDVAI